MFLRIIFSLLEERGGNLCCAAAAGKSNAVLFSSRSSVPRSASERRGGIFLFLYACWEIRYHHRFHHLSNSRSWAKYHNEAVTQKLLSVPKHISETHKTLLHLSCVFVVCSPRHLEDTPNGTCVLGLRRLLFCWLVFITRWLSRLSCFIIRGSEHMARRSKTAARWFQTRVGESETFLNKKKKKGVISKVKQKDVNKLHQMNLEENMSGPTFLW